VVFRGKQILFTTIKVALFPENEKRFLTRRKALILQAQASRYKKMPPAVESRDGIVNNHAIKYAVSLRFGAVFFAESSKLNAPDRK
jgi:hypothetical protein